MSNKWEVLAAATSTALRASAFVFLRWIPGHHFPPLIVTLLVAYLSIVYNKSAAFGRRRPSLREAFPAVFSRKKVETQRGGNRGTVEVVDDGYEDPAVYQDERPYFKTLMLGIPDWREREYSYLTMAVNVLLAVLTLDLVFRGPLLHPATELTFSRVGYVDESSAKILIREPDVKKLPLYAYYKTTSDSEWNKIETIYYLGPETDYTHPIAVTGLSPETAYLYSISNDLTGTFRTAASPQSPNANSLTFLTSSCIKANFPYKPFSHSLAIHGFEHLSRLVRSLASAPSFMLFLGDFIYVDVPQRLSSSFAHYRSEYRRVYASPSWKLRGLSELPWLHTLDDHEIANDWSGGNKAAPFPAASDPFIHYHVSVNPPLPPKEPNHSETNTTYFQFTQGPASFFMLDTRRYRTDPERSDGSVTKPLYGSSDRSHNPPTPSEEPASMLGTAQLASLLAFLRSPEPAHVHWKFVASSVPFTKNWRFGTSDTWGGFLTERSKILTAMHEAEAYLGVRVVVLSGDRHEFAAIRFPPPVTSVAKGNKNEQGGTHAAAVEFDTTSQSGPHEFSVGPLSMFYLPIRTFKQIDDEDVAIKYVPDGNSKVGVVSIHNLAGGDNAHGTGRKTGFFGTSDNKARRMYDAGQQRSLMKYSLWVDGKISWEYTLTSPAAFRASTRQ